jgi:hypothetical protein
VWDANVDAGTRTVGSFMQWSTIGSINGGANQTLNTLRDTELSPTDDELTTNFAPVANGEPLTINYYTGGIGGTLVYTEQYNGASPTLEFSSLLATRKAGHDAGSDNGGNAAVVTAAGITLPASDDIDYVDIVPMTAGTVSYSTIDLTAGGGITSFTLDGELVAVPEPAAAMLLGVGALAFRRRR